MDTAEKKLVDVCFSYHQNRLKRLKKYNYKVAHYTSAENGINILNTKSLWLRSAAVMNDFSEVTHGRECLDYSLNRSDVGRRFVSIVNDAYPKLADEIVSKIDDLSEQSVIHTYISSLSETRADDELGRLSMWRAYGGSVAGVAIIFNADIFEEDTSELNTYSSAVLYSDPENFSHEFAKIVARFELDQGLIGNVSSAVADFIIFNALQFSILSTKHLGFQEEKEWRIIHSPKLSPSQWVKPIIRIVSGVPQRIYRLPLQSVEGMNLPMIDLRNLIHRVIIGPTQHPKQIRDAYVDTLKELGFNDPEKIVYISQIPLRSQA